MSGTESILAQADVALDYSSDLLGPVLIFFGLELMLAGTFHKVLSESGLSSELTQRERLVAVGGLTVGLLFAASGALRMFGILEVYVIFLFCLGRVIEGAGAVRFYRRVIDYVRGKGSPSGLKKRVSHGLFLLFVTFLAVWLAFRVLTDGPIVGSTVQSLRLIWTAFVVVTVGVGIARKLSYGDPELNLPLKAGMILAVVGAEVFNFGSLSLELTTYIVGSAAFSLGFWVAVYYIFRGGLEASGASTSASPGNCPNCGASQHPNASYCPDCGQQL